MANDITINLNKMKCNITKCKELIISFAKDKRSFQPLTVAGDTIELVESEKILEIVLQDNLKRSLYVDSIVMKSSKRLYTLKLLKRSKADTNAMIVVYTTVVEPILSMLVKYGILTFKILYQMKSNVSQSVH